MSNEETTTAEEEAVETTETAPDEVETPTTEDVPEDTEEDTEEETAEEEAE